MTSSSGDRRGVDYMTRSHPLFGIAGNASLRVRRRAYDWLAASVGGFAGKVILDNGATPDTLSPDSNCLIRWFLEDEAEVYSTSPEDIDHLPALFPGLRLLPWPPVPGALAFDLVVASSVVQHVGAGAKQQEYVRGLLSFGVPVFLTTPNRRHWLEFHTKLPFVHWLPKDRHRRVLSRLGMQFWSQEANLNLLVREELAELLVSAARDGGSSIRMEWFETRFLGGVSNLAVLATPQ